MGEIQKLLAQKNSKLRHGYHFNENNAIKTKINFKIRYLYIILIIGIILSSIGDINNYE